MYPCHPEKLSRRRLAGAILFLGGLVILLADLSLALGGHFPLIMPLSLGATCVTFAVASFVQDWDSEARLRRACGYFLELERRLDTQLDAIGEKLGLDLRDELAERIRNRLANYQYEMALIEYRQRTGAAVGLTFEAAAEYPEAALERKLDAILGALEDLGRIPTTPKTLAKAEPGAIQI
jgi:hypothetical protein